MSDDPMRLGDQQAWIDLAQKYVDANYYLTKGTYNSGGKQFYYSIYVADALHTGIDLYPVIYSGLISDPNGDNQKRASFIQFTNKQFADKYCATNLEDPTFLPSYFPSSIHDEATNKVFVCVRPIEGFINLTYSCPEKTSFFSTVFGNPTIWTIERIKEIVQVFISMVKHDALNSLWNSVGCYFLCDGKIKVIVNEFKVDYTPLAWEDRIAQNLMELAYGLYNLFLSPHLDWPLRDSFLDFFDTSNSIDPDVRNRLKRILTHPFLMEDPWEIIQLAHKAFQSFDVIPHGTPGYRYYNLYQAITNGSFISSLDSGKFTTVAKSGVWKFYCPLSLPFQNVYHNNPGYNHQEGLHFSTFVRDLTNQFQGNINRNQIVVNPNGVTPFAAHREMEMILPGFFHRLHEFS